MWKLYNGNYGNVAFWTDSDDNVRNRNERKFHEIPKMDDEINEL